MNNGLHAWPNVSLVSNRGFDGEGTNTFGEHMFASLALEDLGELLHPDFVVPSRDADEFAFLHRRGGLGLIEKSKYGFLYPWILRRRQLAIEGLVPYFFSRILRG
jgi:hypothetical protein